MAKKKDAGVMPQGAEIDMTPGSNITYASDVVAIIAGLAATEVEGIAGMTTAAGPSVGKNKNVTRGIKIEMGTEEVAVDLYVIVEYGTPIQRAAMDAQENVRKAIESMTGLHVVRVDVHVQNVSFEQENKALQAGAQNALEAGTTDLSEPTEAKDIEPKQTKAAEPKQAKAAEPKQAKDAEPKPAKDAEPKKAKEVQTEKTEKAEETRE